MMILVCVQQPTGKLKNCLTEVKIKPKGVLPVTGFNSESCFFFILWPAESQRNNEEKMRNQIQALDLKAILWPCKCEAASGDAYSVHGLTVVRISLVLRAMC
jgi:hypothetical protein